MVAEKDTEELISGMPPTHRGRGRTICSRAKYEAARELKNNLKGLEPHDWWIAVELWLKEHDVT